MLNKQTTTNNNNNTLNRDILLYWFSLPRQQIQIHKHAWLEIVWNQAWATTRFWLGPWCSFSFPVDQPFSWSSCSFVRKKKWLQRAKIQEEKWNYIWILKNNNYEYYVCCLSATCIHKRKGILCSNAAILDCSLKEYFLCKIKAFLFDLIFWEAFKKLKFEKCKFNSEWFILDRFIFCGQVLRFVYWWYGF